MDSEASSNEEKTAESISSIVFDFSRQDQLQFEVAASSILSAATLATAPPGFKGHIIRAAALILPAIAVFHWSLEASRFSDEEFYFGFTYRIVEFLGIIVVFHILHISVSAALHASPVPLGNAAAHLLGAILLTLIAIIFIEFVYKAYLLFWGTATYLYAASAVESMENSDNALHVLANYGLYNYTAQLSYLLLRDSIPEGDSEELRDLRDFVSEVEDHLEKDQPSHSRLFIGAAIIIVPLFVVISYLLSTAVVRVPFLDVLLILLATRLTKHVIEVPALVFGTLSFPDFLQTNFKSLLTIAFYTISVYWLFFS